MSISQVKNSTRSEYIIDTVGCKIPNLDPFDPEVMAMIIKKPYMSCPRDKETVKVKFNSTTKIFSLSIDEKTVLAYSASSLECEFENIIRGDGDDSIDFRDSVKFNKSIDIPESIDQFCVACSVQGSEIYRNCFALIRDKRENKTEEHRNGNKPDSILILGIDSISRSAVIRTMPKTWSYLQSSDRWFDMPGFNRVADNTYPNVMPVFTGLKIFDNNDPCRGNEDGGLDKCPFIWKQMKDLGYVTAYAEDFRIKSFNYNKKGFWKPPTDFYFKPFYMALQSKLDNSRDCLGFKHESEYVYDYMMDYVKTFKGSSFFGLFWANTFTHEDQNLASSMDQKFVEYLMKLEKNGIFNESVVILMADHGSRKDNYADVKVTAFETNLPVFQISLPPSLLTAEVKNALEVNRNRLFGAFDVHKTLLDIIGKDAVLDDCPHCQSILKPIPQNRSCEEAAIPNKFCSCQET